MNKRLYILVILYVEAQWYLLSIVCGDKVNILCVKQAKKAARYY